MRWLAQLVAALAVLAIAVGVLVDRPPLVLGGGCLALGLVAGRVER